MADFESADLFTDVSLATDPHPYYRHLREKAGAVRLPYNDVVATVGYEETLAVLRDDDRFSAVNAINGPFPPLPFTPKGDDITDQIDAFRQTMPFGGLIASQDPPLHPRTRSLLGGIITPKRLKENEASMWKLADRQIDSFFDRGRFEVVREYGKPFAAMVIADLLGVPPEDQTEVAGVAASGSVVPGTIGAVNTAVNPLEAMGMRLYQYLAERRAQPRADVLTDLALARYPDGTLSELTDVVGLATFLFAAGQDTTVRLFTAALKYLAEDADLQARVRAERSLIPNLIEEALRLDGAVKGNFRLSKVPVKVGELELPPGTHVMQLLAAANRDPQRFERPDEIDLDRRNIKEHLSFGHGIHACPGAPLARIEAKVTLERLFERVADIRIDEDFHGPADARRFEYEPTYMFHGLNALHLRFTPA
jgi:cytochrome P450